MSTKRERTDSAREERNVTEFVDATTSFESNVKFFPAAEAKDVAKNVLLVGTLEQLKDGAVASLPFWSEAVTEAIAAAAPGKIYSTLSAGRHVSVGIVTNTASRHNCAVRPDVITSLVKAAVNDGKRVAALDVFVRTSAELPIVAAIARGAATPFTAKNGRSQNAYTSESAAVRVFFPGATKRSSEEMNAVATSVQLCQRLVEAPTNLLDTVTFAEIATVYGSKLGFDVQIKRGEQLREEGYGGLYGVGKAAEFPPALVTLSYKPKGGIEPLQKIAFVGKGIVFDTGGLSIKTPGSNMCGMKRDMGGAAGVFTGFLALVRLGAPAQLSCTLCLADNAISAVAQRNDDIVIMKSGLTIEINNTDAEGRLVLGDGVYHASTELAFTPDLILDMATLTGAQGIACGKNHAGLYTNSGEWEERIVGAGRKCGDMSQPVVYCPEFHNPEFSSKVADYRNSVSDRSNAQVSCAGQFIGNNLAKNYQGSWAHIDMAAPAAKEGYSTGWGPSLLVQLFDKEW